MVSSASGVYPLLLSISIKGVSAAIYIHDYITLSYFIQPKQFVRWPAGINSACNHLQAILAFIFPNPWDYDEGRLFSIALHGCSLHNSSGLSGLVYTLKLRHVFPKIRVSRHNYLRQRSREDSTTGITLLLLIETSASCILRYIVMYRLFPLHLKHS